MAVLSIHEHQRVPISERFCNDSRAPSLRHRDVKLLLKLNSHYRRSGFPEPFEINNLYVKAKQYVGVVCLGRDSLEVLPKIENLDPQANSTIASRIRLAEMLQETRRLELGITPFGAVRVFESGILEVFFKAFLDNLQHASRSGLIRQYVTLSGRLPVLKGRWQLGHQVKLGPQHAHLFECTFEELTEDNPYNQLLKQALRIICSYSQTLDLQDRARRLLFVFEPITDITSNNQKLERNRQTRAFDLCLNLAGFFVKSTSPDVTHGEAANFATFFDMNKLFEEYFARTLFRTLPGRVHIQRPERHLAIEEETGMHLFRMKPDILISGSDGHFKEIVDTKWKRLSLEKPNYGVSQGDVYQVLTYARQYGCRFVSLVFPANDDIRGLVTTLTVKDGGEVIRIIALELDDPNTFKAQLDEYWSKDSSAV
jgi:5-methylcytosine-specific restriction enzyme subunit McrC